MNSSRSVPRPARAVALLAWALLASLLFGSPAHAGNGRFKNGLYDFCVSVRFQATPAQLAKIKTIFQGASAVLADATDGQHRFGKVIVVNNSKGSDTAEYWVNSGTGRAYATYGKYGVRGEHVNLYYDEHFGGSNGDAQNSYTVAHEHGHHSWGIADEYSGPGGNAECAAPPDTATLNYCLMDNYKARGGRSTPAGTLTLNEFCVASNHDPDRDTHQHARHNKSCWETIAAHPTRAATAPSGLPVSNAPAAGTVTFDDGFDGLRVMLVIDRSGSMAQGGRLGFAKSAASAFINFLPESASVGVASFSSGAGVNAALTPIDQGGRAAALAAVSSLNADGTTNIGGGLLAGLSGLTGQPDRSCNEVIVLLTDGEHNEGTPPAAALPTLVAEGVTVFSTGLGIDIGAVGQAILQDIASGTGGAYLSAAEPFDLLPVYFQIAANTTSEGLLLRQPARLLTGGTASAAVLVEPGTTSVRFAVAFAGEQDQIALRLRTPSGRIITRTVAVNGPIEFSSGPNIHSVTVGDPEPGVWRVLAGGTAILDGRIEFLAASDHQGVRLNVSLEKQTVSPAEAMLIEATPQFDGEAVVGALITAIITRPDGTVRQVVLRDDGRPASGDAVAGDGIYAARFSDYAGEGTYRIEATATVQNGRTYEGERIDAATAPSNSEAVPPFVRAASTSGVLVAPTQGQAPAAPSGLEVAGLGPGSLTLAWTDNSNNETGFEIYRQAPGGGFTLLSTVGTDTTTFTDTTLRTGTPYVYHVRAANAAGRSEPSNELRISLQRGGYLLLFPHRIDFGSVRLGKKGAGSVLLVNAGSGPLTVAFRRPRGPFALDGPASFTMAPFSLRRVTVRFRPTAAGPARGRMAVSHTGRALHRHVVRLRGRGLRRR